VADKVRTFSITVTVLAENAERVGAEIAEFFEKQMKGRPDYVASFSCRDEEV
jgi:hypothetical protein